MMRKKMVAGNWKMNHSYHEAVALFAALMEHKDEIPKQVNVVLIPASLYLREFTKKSSEPFMIGAQNCHYESSGAFTGEISPEMLKSVGVKYVIIGHSERRNLFHEDDQLIANKIKKALNVSLNVIFCCGEAKEIRENQNHFAWVESQIKSALFELSTEQLKKVTIAYEPVWAIGTGVTATPDEAQEMHKFIRNCIREKFGNDAADSISILYGGSCNAENAHDLFVCPDIDGGLIGGASLKVATFLPIIKAAG